MSLKAIHLCLDQVQKNLVVEKAKLIKTYPIRDFNQAETYAFTYVRTENAGLNQINQALRNLRWLPLHLDPSGEMMGKERGPMTRWLKSEAQAAPDAAAFGNDFMHALTRCALVKGANSPEYRQLSAEIIGLFQNLACLIGIAWYCNWLSDHGVEQVTVSDPQQLIQTAAELLIEVKLTAETLRAREMRDFYAGKGAAPPPAASQQRTAKARLQLVTPAAFTPAGSELSPLA